MMQVPVTVYRNSINYLVIHAYNLLWNTANIYGLWCLLLTLEGLDGWMAKNIGLQGCQKKRKLMWQNGTGVK